MILSKAVTLDEKDFTTTGQHPDNTILVTFEGPGASKTPLLQLQQFLQYIAKQFNVELHISGIRNHYRGEEACRVFFPLPDYVREMELHNRQHRQDGILYTAYLPHRVPKKIFLNFVPPTISDAELSKLISTFISPTNI